MATIRPRAAFRTLPSDADITGRNFGAEEVKHLQKVIESGTLRRTNGGYVSQFESERRASPNAPAQSSLPISSAMSATWIRSLSWPLPTASPSLKTPGTPSLPPTKDAKREP